MKPLKLRLSGLQSYREQQEIDFARLCEAGVFGIFGPTGSGKSSILDAMTLALYGKVERASGGTQGIMNQAESKLAVSFTFELSGAGETRLYRVERQFKRSGEMTVSNTLSRFVEVTEEGEAVLADKLADVNRMAEERIGLNMQDFTRAVVLPQGKFAEFLSLTGKERRQMLQRLFRLERFGDGLTMKLNQRLKAAESALQETAAEQQGLGDASSAAVAAAAERLEQARHAAAAARQSLELAESRHKELLEVRERQEAVRLQEQEQQRLAADAPRIEALESELKRLDAAERIMPVLDAAAGAREAQQQASVRRTRAEHSYIERKQEAEAAAQAWAGAADQAADLEPKLLQRLERLREAERLEGESAKLSGLLQEEEQQLQKTAEQAAELAARKTKAEDTEQRAVAKQDELKKALKGTELTAAERERRSLMQRQVLQLESAMKRLAAAKAETAEGAERLDELDRQEQHAAAQSRAQTEALVKNGRAIHAVQQEMAALEQELLHAGERLPAMLELCRQAKASEERAQLAGILAADLRSGEACPVCGSCDHPHPRSGENAGVLHGDDAGQWSELQQNVQQLLYRLSPMKLKAEGWFQRLQEVLPEENARELLFSSASDVRLEAAAAAAGELAASSLSGISAGAAASVSGYSASLLEPYRRFITSMHAAVQRLEQELKEQETRCSHERQQYIQQHRHHEEIIAARNVQAKLHAEQAARARQQQAETDALHNEWVQTIGADIAPDQAHIMVEALEVRERQAEELKARIEKSVTFIEDTKKQLLELQDRLHGLKLTEVELTSKCANIRQQLEERQQRILQLTGGGRPGQLIAAAGQELAALKNRLKMLQTQNEASQQALREAGELRSAAAEGSAAADRRQEETAQLLQAALESSPFERAEEVESLRSLVLVKEAKRSEAAQYHERRQQMETRLALLRDQLAGRSVTEEEWQAAAAILEQARGGHDEAVQQAAKSERDWEDLSAKNIRWEQLEVKRLEMEALSGRLKALQGVFRGNAFVEYVAEEQLVQVCRSASERLGFLTKRRYALEVDSGGGFVIRDDANGGIRRPVSTLSGGETFLASLALALALSGQIQLRGKYPLQFFFLDEGFGTLDPELLETVITALEKLHHERLAVGVISHVPELRGRLPRRLVVTSAEPSGKGSTVMLETM